MYKIGRLEKGITLISLVITIILLLILAGVSIAILTGDNGLLERARTARENTEKAEYKEIIRMAQTEENITTDRLRGKETKLNGIAEILNKDKKLGEGTGTQITKEYQDKENPRLVIKTKEGWVYIVTVDGIEELGKVEENIPLDIEIKNGDIKYLCDPDYWTDTDVEVSLSIEKEEYKEFNIQYSYDLKTWKDYTEKLVVEKNKEIYSRLSTGASVSKSYATGNVTNIDKDKPTIGGITEGFTIVSGNTGTITVSSISDTGGSGLSGIYISTSSTKPTAKGVTWTENTASSYKKTVTTGGTYYVWVKDSAGNVSDAKTCTVTAETAIAKVENIYYSSIANAINSISSSGNVVMCTDTTEHVTIPSGKNINLNTNSKTITGILKNNGTVTISGGGSIWYHTGYAMINNANATLESGSISLASGGYEAVYNKGTFIMRGGNISSSGNVAVMNNKKFYMTAGTLSGANYALVTRGENAVSSITGGNIENNSTAHFAIQVDDNGAAYIYNTTITSPQYAIALASNNSYGHGVRLIDCNISGRLVNNTTGTFTEVVRTSTGYNIYYYDSIASVSAVQFPTWTSANDQDDLIWHEGQIGTRSGSRCFWYEVKKSEHNNETGKYNTHIYADNVCKDGFSYTVK